MIDLFVAEFSVSQNCFNVCSLNESVVSNKRIITSGGSTDYLTVGIAETREDAHKICENLRHIWRS